MDYLTPDKMFEDITKEIDKEEMAKFLETLHPKTSFAAPIVKRGHLHFMIGLPRSGKSTWATNWVRSPHRRIGDVQFPRVIVCADKIRLAVSGQRFNSRLEPMVHMVKDYMIETLLSSGHDVVVDGTHTTKPSIRRMFQIDPKASWTLINTSPEICVERATATGQSDLVPIIERMGKQLRRILDAGLPQVCKELQAEIRGYGEHRMV